jgi:hypothetical protein
MDRAFHAAGGRWRIENRRYHFIVCTTPLPCGLDAGGHPWLHSR